MLQGVTLVVGGGVIGLLTAYELALTGAEVILLERQAVGSEASWAGGGIISPLYPWRYGRAVGALAAWSQVCYSELAHALRKVTAIDSEVFTTGLYWLDLEDEEEALRWAERESKTLCRAPMEQVRATVPALGQGFERALYMPRVANVRNPRLMRALRASLQTMSNVYVREHCSVRGFISEQGSICGVITGDGVVRAQRVVLAAGAWSGELLKLLGVDLPVAPVKGQMILYRCNEGFLPSMVLARGRYAIPRKDGHVLVGSTLEHVGFDKVPTESALVSLTASAVALLPALEDAEVVGHWAGLRPGSPQGIPYIGEMPGHPGLWLNCGHYRNGLVLAPASCRLLGDLLLSREPIVDPAPYSPVGRLG